MSCIQVKHRPKHKILYINNYINHTVEICKTIVADIKQYTLSDSKTENLEYIQPSNSIIGLKRLCHNLLLCLFQFLLYVN